MDLLFPPSLYCSCCGNLIDETRIYNLCDHCVRHIKWDLDDSREKNGMKLLRCAEYGIYERTLIFSLKYNGKKYIARDIAAMMKDRLELSETEFDIIVPVPMNRDKERKRGFNQTVLIGKHLAGLTGHECLQLLKRTRDTAPMRGLSPTEREMNVKGSFVIDESIGREAAEGRKILLLDDFFTTGSTAEECRRILETAAPAEVVFLAFAAKY